MTKICYCPKDQKGAEKKIREATLSAMNMRLSEPKQAKPQKIKKHFGDSKFITAFLGSLSVLLMLATSWLAYSKFENEDMNAYRPNPIVVVPDDSHKGGKPIETDYLTKHQAETMMAQVQGRIDDLERQMQLWNHRSWLLALAVNENANISQGIDNRYHSCHPHSGYITFDQDWKIKRYPETMQLTPDQREALRNDVR